MAVIADLRRLADHDPHAVVDEEPIADRRARVDLDAGERASDVGDEAGQQRHPALAQRVGQPVELPGVKARVGENDFQVAGGRRVPVPGGLNIAGDALQE